MATTPRRRTVCWYCRKEQPDAGHHVACPLAGPIGPLSDKKIRGWNKGYDLGLGDSHDEDDTHVFSRQVYNYSSQSYILGYDLGRYECETAVCRAVGDDYYDNPDEGYSYVTVYLFR